MSATTRWVAVGSDANVGIGLPPVLSSGTDRPEDDGWDTWRAATPLDLARYEAYWDTYTDRLAHGVFEGTARRAAEAAVRGVTA